MIDAETKSLWLKELEASAVFLESLYRSTHWDPQLEFEVEKSIFLGFYSIRKLIESNLLDRKITSINWKFMAYPKHEKNKTEKWINDYNHWDGNERQMVIEKLSNQFIHSKLFSPFVPEGTRCVGLYFVSDNESEKELYYIQLVKIVNIFFSVVQGRKIDLALNIEENEISVKSIEKHITSTLNGTKTVG